MTRPNEGGTSARLLPHTIDAVKLDLGGFAPADPLRRRSWGPSRPRSAPAGRAVRALDRYDYIMWRLDAAAVVLAGFMLAACSSGPSLPVNSQAERTQPREDLRWSPRLKLDMDAIFPRGAGRDLLLYNCTNCHSFVRIVRMQRTKGQWALVKKTMRPRVSGLTDEQVDVLFTYLETSFNDAKPEPELPEWFLETERW